MFSRLSMLTLTVLSLGACVAGQTAPSNPSAPGITGGEAYFAVSGAPSAGVVNLRAEPSNGAGVVGALGNGDRVRNLGCRTERGTLWCRVELLDEMGGTGWVEGRFLRPSSD